MSWAPFPPSGIIDPTGPATPNWCTDEDCAKLCGTDFALIAPPAVLWAQGADGAILAASPWHLTSAASDFVAQGIPLGSVLTIMKDTQFGPNGQNYAVAAVVDLHTLALKNVGIPAGMGMPPVAADASGIAFSAPTLWPLIEEASYYINGIYNINRYILTRSPDQLRFPRELRELCVYRTLQTAYMSQERAASAGRDDFADKAKQFGAAFEDLKPSVQLDWTATADESAWNDTRVGK